MAPRNHRGQPPPEYEPRWSDGTGYHLYLPAFLDSNGDGHGDLRGVLRALNYFSYLGEGHRAVGAPRRESTSGIDWLMLGPISKYDPEGQDAVYQVTDYRQIAPEIGTVEEFKQLSREAEARGMGLMVDAVFNHTGDRHPWFQEALRDPTSPKREYYHFFPESECHRWALKRPLFPDATPRPYSHHPDDVVEDSYYLHTFYSGQPDLNIGNPELRAELRSIIRYKLGVLGAGAVRLDGCTFYDDASGTTGETQPLALEAVEEWTRDFMAPAGEFPTAWALAETNQAIEIQAAWMKWAHSAYNFHLMNAIFIAFYEGEWGRVVALLERLAVLDPEGRFSNFLRNHDEFTLEMATEEDREFLYGVAAGRDRRYRVNIGLRQRLADLVRGNPEAIKTLLLLLVCLRGKPWIYMGDEIGAHGARDLYVRDPRDASRTPFQWTGRDANAGFSTAPADRLWLPVAPDYRQNNVESQWGEPDSILEFTRKAVALRRDSIALKQGDQEVLPCSNPAILVLLRRHAECDVIVFLNIAHTPSRGYVDLSRWQSCRLEEALEGKELPFLGAGRDYLVELGAYGRRVLLPFVR